MTVPWLERPRSPQSAGARLRSLIAGKTAIAVPGAHDGMAAVLARASRPSRPSIFSGAALSASMAPARSRPPDASTTWRDETREMMSDDDLPLIVDCDTGSAKRST